MYHTKQHMTQVHACRLKAVLSFVKHHVIMHLAVIIPDVLKH